MLLFYCDCFDQRFLYQEWGKLWHLLLNHSFISIVVYTRDWGYYKLRGCFLRSTIVKIVTDKTEEVGSVCGGGGLRLGEWVDGCFFVKHCSYDSDCELLGFWIIFFQQMVLSVFVLCFVYPREERTAGTFVSVRLSHTDCFIYGRIIFGRRKHLYICLSFSSLIGI